MKFHRRAFSRCIAASAGALSASLSAPLFLLCVSAAISPGILLACLLGWKAFFFPASMPGVVWILFLPMWLILSCGIPSVIAAALLSARCICTGWLAVLIPVCTAQLLLSYLWALCLLYRMPMPLCVFSCAVCAVSALLNVRALWRWYPILGTLMLIDGVWNTLLVFLCADF